MIKKGMVRDIVIITLQDTMIIGELRGASPITTSSEPWGMGLCPTGGVRLGS